MMMRSFMALALMLALLQGCGGGGSDSTALESAQPSSPPSESTQPSSPPSESTPPSASHVVQVGDFELIAGTLDLAAPAGAPRCQSGPALGAALVNTDSDNTPSYYGTMAVGSNGHIYWLSAGCDSPKDSLNLIEIDPSTGQMRVQPVPYDPAPEGSQTLTKVYRPVAIAVASDGSVLIADAYLNVSYNGMSFYSVPVSNHPAGIWRFKDGTLSKLAGFDRPVPVTISGDFQVNFLSWSPSEDGQGSQVIFSYGLSAMCAGPNDTFYVLEKGSNGKLEMSFGEQAYRKISLDGTVETIARISQDNYSQLICATNHRVIANSRSRKNFINTVFVDLVSGQDFGKEYSSNISYRYGFGDGLALGYGDDAVIDGKSSPTLFIVDMKFDMIHGEIKKDPWIEVPCIYSSNCTTINTDTNFQLNSMPYVMYGISTLPEVVVDNNNYAYLRSGNALLRYKLPDSVQPQ